MAVKPVEYIKDSSTAGFAVAGDEKTITKTNANTIQKDVNQGNTEDLDNAQVKILNTWVNPDDITYTADEQQNVGKNRLGPDKAKGSSGVSTNGATGTAVVGALGGALSNAGGNLAGGLLGGAASTSTTVSAGIGKQSLEGTTKSLGGGAGFGDILNVGKDVQKSGTTVHKSSKIPWGAVVAGTIATATGYIAQRSVSNFDNQYGNRMDYKNSAEDTNGLIQQYYDAMSSDMDSALADIENYQELIATKTETDMTRTIEIGALEAEKNVYLSRGDTARAEEIQKKIDEMTEGAKDDPLGEEIKALQEGMEGYYSHNNEALGVADAGTTISDFLKEGEAMGWLAYVNAGCMLIGAAFMSLGSIEAVKAVAKVPTLLKGAAMVIAIAGAAMMVAGNAMVLIAANRFKNVAENEMNCDEAGTEMAEYVADLKENVEGQAGLVEETAGTYEEGDKKYAETMQKTQEAVDKALADQNTEPNPKKEKPNEPGNPTNPNDPPGDNPPPEK